MSEWIKQAATQILPLAASGICNDEDGNVKPTADVIEEIIHDAYMDRDGELRDLLCCPPDCDLTSWAKRLGNFWHDLEGGQVVESLKQQLAEANARCAAMQAAVNAAADTLWNDAEEWRKAGYLGEAIAACNLSGELREAAKKEQD